MHDTVASVLEIVELHHDRIDVGEVGAELGEQLGRLDIVLRGLFEPIEKIAVLLARLQLLQCVHMFLLGSQAVDSSAIDLAGWRA